MTGIRYVFKVGRYRETMVRRGEKSGEEEEKEREAKEIPKPEARYYWQYNCLVPPRYTWNLTKKIQGRGSDRTGASRFRR